MTNLKSGGVINLIVYWNFFAAKVSIVSLETYFLCSFLYFVALTIYNKREE